MIKRTIFIFILSIIGIGVLIIMFFACGFESRTYFWRVIDGGFILLLGISLLLFYYLVTVLYQGRLLKGLVILIPTFLVSTCTGMSLDFYPQYQDYVVYQAKDGTSKVILQYYETGVTGNPRERLIKVQTLDGGIRPYEEISEKAIRVLSDSVLPQPRIWRNSPPVEMEINGKKYQLEKINQL